ncbi:MAG: DUF3102 domain-containing protein [Treponema sp.]|nr:DUF3102 domain-containing protein [Candidatus Treponema caballi]
MNDIITAEFRDINTITTEIKVLQKQTERLVLEYAIEVGRRLCEAKELLEHGEWGKWLKEEVSFSQSTANNLMKIYTEYGDAQGCLFGARANSQALGNLSYTKALSLLALPENEREDFVKEHDVENISTRELDRLIKEKEAVERKLGDTQIELDKAKDDLAASRHSEKQAIDRLKEAQADVKAADDQAQENENKLQAELESAIKAKEKAEADFKAASELNEKQKKKYKEELKKLRENPEIPQETLDKLRTEAEEKNADALKKAERELKEATEREEALRKQLQLAAPDTAIFKMLFSTVKEDYNKLSGCLLKIRTDNPELAAKLTAAVKDLLNKYLEVL